ncbi:MAG: helix-hairpin-helix domain-containing protein [Dermatophilaceae bacterium]
MARPTPPDPALVERVRQLLAGPGPSAGPSRASSREPDWVPGPPAGAVPPAPPRVVTLPAFLRHARVRPSRRGLAAMVVLVVVCGAVLGLRVAVAVRQGEPVAVAGDRSGLLARSLPPGFTALASVTAQSAGAVSSSEASAGASVSAGGASPTVLVHVVGQVARPGVVAVGAGSRVADAVAKAGGALPGADLERVNLARLVIDGEQVHVPAPGEPLTAADGPGPSAGTAVGVATRDGHQLVNLNTADVAALDTLPGVGPVLAQRIVQWRQEHGRFTAVEELNEVSGIGDKLFAQLRARITV